MKSSTLLLTTLSAATISAVGFGFLYSSSGNTERFSNQSVSDNPEIKHENFKELHTSKENEPDLSYAPAIIKLGEPQPPTIIGKINDSDKTWQVDKSVSNKKTCTDWGGSWQKRGNEPTVGEDVCYRLLSGKIEN